MAIYKFKEFTPVISEKAFVHESAVIIGDVFIEEGVYVAPFASIRGDFGRIIIKKNANVQDSCTIHSFPSIDVILEPYAHIGHGAILHGCHIEENAMIGMGAIIMDEATIGKNSIIGAASFVPSKMQIPANHLAFGSPAKVRRELEKSEIEWKKEGTDMYVELAYDCMDTLELCEPLRENNKERDALRLYSDYKPKGQ